MIRRRKEMIKLDQILEIKERYRYGEYFSALARSLSSFETASRSSSELILLQSPMLRETSSSFENFSNAALVNVGSNFLSMLK